MRCNEGLNTIIRFLDEVRRGLGWYHTLFPAAVVMKIMMNSHISFVPLSLNFPTLGISCVRTRQIVLLFYDDDMVVNIVVFGVVLPLSMFRQRRYVFALIMTTKAEG